MLNINYTYACVKKKLLKCNRMNCSKYITNVLLFLITVIPVKNN